MGLPGIELLGTHLSVTVWIVLLRRGRSRFKLSRKEFSSSYSCCRRSLIGVGDTQQVLRERSANITSRVIISPFFPGLKWLNDEWSWHSHFSHLPRDFTHVYTHAFPNPWASGWGEQHKESIVNIQPWAVCREGKEACVLLFRNKLSPYSFGNKQDYNI